MSRSILIVASLVAATGCGDNLTDATGNLRLADGPHLQRAIAAASAADAVDAVELAIELAGTYGPTDCPRVRVGDGITEITGCGDDVIAGRVVIEGPMRSNEVSREVVRVTFEGFFDGHRRFDGVVERSTDGAALMVDLDVVAEGIASTASLTFDCDGVGLCEPAAGGLVAVDGLGELTVRGAWRHAPSGGWLTLVGVESMTLDLNAVTGGCIPYTMSGDAGWLCD